MAKHKSLKVQILITYLWILLAGSAVSAREKCSFACKEIPDTSEVLTSLGRPVQNELPENLKIYVWNIYKSRNEPWQKQFDTITKDADLILFQETMINPEYLPNYQRDLGFGWGHATSYFYDDNYNSLTGVATAAKTIPVAAQFFRTKVKEPFVKSYKLSLLTKYPIKNRQDTLAVVNIHGINRHTETELKEQVNAAIDQLKNHNGPILFAGDFNTRNEARTKAVDQAMSQIGLKRVKWSTDIKPYPLDHAYVRALKV
jgi:endonuclease/exonuclease/phosphatase (EEP) superfamily protein YafD